MPRTLATCPRKRGHGTRLEDETDDDVYWTLSDHEGSIRDVVTYDDGSGVTTVEEHRQYDSFGQVISTTGSATPVAHGSPSVPT